MTKKIAVLAGDAIGPEIIAEAIKVLDFLNTDIYAEGMQKVSTVEMGAAVVSALKNEG
ncbi:MAG: hypothetical protein ABL925_04000 [Methylococcales bacterium]